MRLAISGTACQGKTTLLKSFIEKWDMYETPKVSYRSLLKPGAHSKETSMENQWDILNHMIDSMETYDENSYVIYDRCPLDNLIYSMWAFHKGKGDITEAFIEKCIPIVKESMHFLDIIFFVPITNAAQSDIDDDGVRETDSEYIKEIDNLFKAMYTNWAKEDERFFPKEERAAMVEVFGTTEERIRMLGFYLNDAGDVFGEEDSLVDTSVITDEFGFPVGALDDDISGDSSKTYS